jgi:hypothetical protein
MTRKYYASVTYSIYKGEPETAYAWMDRDPRPEENSEKYFRKNFSGDSEKEVLKAAEAYAKAHNKVLREKRAALKAAKLAQKEAVKAEKVAKKEAIVNRVKSFVTPEISKIVNELFEKQKANVLENLKDHYKFAVDKLKEIEGLPPKDEKYKSVLQFGFQGHRESTFAGSLSSWIMEHKKDAQSKYEGYYKPDYPLFFKPDYEKTLEQMIQRDLEMITASFLYKMEVKLGEVIKGKKIKSFDSKGLHQGSVLITFEDGSSFLLINSIEIATSVNGVVFNRFPSRFHNVTFSDGKTGKWVSEQDMKKRF